MKIGFCGLGSTGKTTTLNNLLSFCKENDIELFPSVMTSVLNRYNCFNEGDLLRLRSWELREVQLRGLYARLKKEEQLKEKSWISDRTVLDHFLYLISYCGTYWFSATLCQELLAKVHNSMLQYDYVFYFDSNIFHNVSGNKISNTIHNMVWNNVGVSMLALFPNVITLEGLNIENRVDFIKKYINEGGEK